MKSHKVCEEKKRTRETSKEICAISACMIIIKRTSSDSQRGPPRRRQGEQLGHRARHDLLRRRLGEGGDLSVQLVGQHGGLGHYGGEGRGGPLDPSLRRGVTPSQMGRDLGFMEPAGARSRLQ